MAYGQWHVAVRLDLDEKSIWKSHHYSLKLEKETPLTQVFESSSVAVRLK